MYHFINQEDDEMSILDLFKIDNMSFPSIAAANKESNEFNFEVPSNVAIKPSESEVQQEDKSLSKLKIKREQGKVRAQRARDRK